MIVRSTIFKLLVYIQLDDAKKFLNLMFIQQKSDL
jgi:hypothetical protein